jgi:hypothetical protein
VSPIALVGSEQSTSITRVVDREDVGVLKPSAGAPKCCRPEVRGELAVQQLERDQTIVLEVASQKNCGHAATAELALESVAIA